MTACLAAVTPFSPYRHSPPCSLGIDGLVNFYVPQGDLRDRNSILLWLEWFGEEVGNVAVRSDILDLEIFGLGNMVA